MKKIILVLSLLLFIQPCHAEDTGIHGNLSCRYELADEFPGQIWTIDLHYRFNSLLSVGITEKTFTNGYDTYFKAIPAFYPNGQLYEFYIKTNIIDNLSLKLSQWCNHPVYYGKLDRTITPQGLYIEGKYEF
jgi:hypothetical protein